MVSFTGDQNNFDYSENLMNFKIFIGLVTVDDITIEGAEVTKSLREDAGQEAQVLQAQEVPGHFRQQSTIEKDISQGKN